LPSLIPQRSLSRVRAARLAAMLIPFGAGKGDSSAAGGVSMTAPPVTQCTTKMPMGAAPEGRAPSMAYSTAELKAKHGRSARHPSQSGPPTCAPDSPADRVHPSQRCLKAGDEVPSKAPQADHRLRAARANPPNLGLCLLSIGAGGLLACWTCFLMSLGMGDMGTAGNCPIREIVAAAAGVSSLSRER
jgi:hypothetical protein